MFLNNSFIFPLTGLAALPADFDMLARRGNKNCGETCPAAARSFPAMYGRFPLSRPRRGASHGTEFGSKLSTEHPRPRSASVADCTHCADAGVAWFVAVGATTQGGEPRATTGIPASVPSPRRRRQVVFVWLGPRLFPSGEPSPDPIRKSRYRKCALVSGDFRCPGFCFETKNLTIANDLQILLSKKCIRGRGQSIDVTSTLADSPICARKAHL